MHEFRTTFNIPQANLKFNYHDIAAFIGSCFTENISDKLKLLKFNVICNPFGILYNPLSIQTCINQIINNKQYTAEDLLFFNDKWLSLNHHGCFSNKGQNNCLSTINEHISKANSALLQAKYIFITLGTSIVYFLESNNSVVGNCHKMPSNLFYSRRLSVNETINSINNIVAALTKFNGNINIVLTVSPIRHWKDGAVENQCSKATLILAINEIVKNYNNVNYFPAYELLYDDLRDYRFYEEDMLHPNKIAINYIWEKFIETYIDTSCLEPMKLIEKLNLALAHRSENNSSLEYKKYLNYIENIKKLISEKYPYLL